ncbi:MAG: ribosome biogenesis GTPase YlqF [gamma proteobacterium symbiont of Bathyaustriella thionipta]|nr:ribosome biogenesis GTPase YlqF [gamma proteobacterium symbiont of Bathyaustriella thionipta]MCU7950673.1 ribosome biogenesis GTPase YlqF [gamma proteobacterium symbiont of Bathyaustriella thionipta]MCU7954332.1 ribosome biogenesis GTPase YlqF [gamma proteobacterium symbiont of Bathyaustriella thionipta]MCU7957281.1 ribosome biogenesis GTPase YlqF [gamma proteobacterium symbiont of Bathyaustriella thionipta]MCU7968222.1 ribosome biogenesis GTPase YlqF [gamma proteobacterium symbiont of Bathy
MAIHWYPGHMHKANKEIKEALSRIDLIIEVLDARIPYSSQNPLLSSLRGDKPCIKVLTKSDLADPDLTRQWQNWLEQEQGVKTLSLTTEQPDRMRQLIELSRKMIARLPGKRQLCNTMIMGIPNVGKSSLINILADKIIAKTGNEPAVTKSQQRINLANDFVLYDTPGVLWPKVENEPSMYRLAVTGAVKNTAYEYDDIAFFAAEYLLEAYPDSTMQRYQLEQLPHTELELIEAIGRKRGCLRAAGKVDLVKASKILLSELRSGTLGRISLETPGMIEKELMALQTKLDAEENSKNTKRKKKKRTYRP